MDAEIHWSIWLLSGLAAGLLPMFGENRLIGLIQAFAIIGAPFAIFMNAGANYLPFALFFGGLFLASSFAYKRKRSKDDQALSRSIDKNKKRLGR